MRNYQSQIESIITFAPLFSAPTGAPYIMMRHTGAAVARQIF